MGLDSFITRQRNRYAADLAHSDNYWALSALSFSLFAVLKEVASAYVYGKTLDAGAGWLNAKRLITRYCNEYVSLDIENKTGSTDIVADIQNMHTIPPNSFDTVYSSQVLEHIPTPWIALSEIYRILKSNGLVIVSVPHLSGLHEEPFDFYRYTPHGIRFLFEQAGFKVEREYRAGGLLSFLSHPFSVVLVSLCWPIPWIGWIVWLLNKMLIVMPASYLDTLFKLDRKFPANIVLVARKMPA